MDRPSVRQTRAMQRAVDRVVRYFEVNAWPADGNTRAKCHPKAYLWVRGYLQHVLGWSAVKIEKKYGIKVRTLERWKKKGRGKAQLRQAVEAGEINRDEIVAILTMTD